VAVAVALPLVFDAAAGVADSARPRVAGRRKSARPRPVESAPPAAEQETVPPVNPEPPAPPPPAVHPSTYQPTPPEGKPLAAVMLDEEGLSPEAAAALRRGIAAALGADARLRYRSAEQQLEPAEAADAALDEADRAAVAARAAFAEMDLERARHQAAAALAGYRAFLPRLVDGGGVRRLRDAWMQLASIRFFDADAAGAAEALRHALALDPGLERSEELTPPQMKQLVADEHAAFARLAPGRLEVRSQPSGATVFLDGARRGETPLVLAPTPPGPHVVTLARAGFRSSALDVDLASGSDVTREVALARFDSDPWAAVREGAAQLGAATAPAGVLAAGARLGVDLLAVVRAASDGAKLAGFLYDARTHQLLRKASLPSSRPLEALGAELAAALFAGARLDGRFAPPPPPRSFWASARDRWTGFRSSRWFWPVVGGVAGAAVLGVGLGAGLGSRHGLSTEEQVILLGTGR
jgi:hypothetical protein